MQEVLCRNCGGRMDCQVHAEHVTAGCLCGTRIAAQYVFSWKQVPALLRAHATKAFGAHGKWRIQPPLALAHAFQQHAFSEQAAECTDANA